MRRLRYFLSEFLPTLARRAAQAPLAGLACDVRAGVSNLHSLVLACDVIGRALRSRAAVSVRLDPDDVRAVAMALESVAERLREIRMALQAPRKE